MNTKWRINPTIQLGMNTDPIPFADPTPVELNRFWGYVSKSDNCWEWTGNTWRSGYGRFFFRGHYIAAHRFSYELNVNTVPKELWMDHLCRNRMCVRPDHLEPVTPGENQRRGYADGGRGPGGPPKGVPVGGALLNRQKTHCPEGHPYSGDNLYTDPKRPTGRLCKACRRARNRTYAQKMRGDLP